ncbi:MAG: phosphate/phosphite/phosphonate ABC transporter substrate-binding protein [Nitrospirota bacterium]|nr:phosphate/phosphite/phosphonate ABC transporter substrate-binding protein [Nitrospirota bacterium]
MQNRQWIAIAAVLLVCAAGCSEQQPARKVSLEKRDAVMESAEPHKANTLRFAVGGMITPREGFAYYRQFLDYIGKKTGRHVKYVDREKYEEINRLLATGGVDVAFVCSGPYIDGREKFGLQLLVAPQAYGKPIYYSYTIVHKDSRITRFEDLRGKVFAFTDPDSNTGKLVPEYRLAKMHETSDSFFLKYVYTYKHDQSLKAVAQKVVDGAAVDSLIWEYANRKSPQYTSQTRIIWKSPPYGIPPVVVRPGLDPALKRELKRAFLNAHVDPEGRELLENMMIDRFVEINDSAYDSVREMKSWIGQQKKGKKAR